MSMFINYREVRLHRCYNYSRMAGDEKSDGLGEIFLTRRQIYRTIESSEKCLAKCLCNLKENNFGIRSICRTRKK